MQNLIMDRSRDVELKPTVLAQLARAFKELEELKRKIRMKPDPRPVDVTPKRRSHPKGAPTFLELPKPADPKAGAA